GPGAGCLQRETAGRAHAEVRVLRLENRAARVDESDVVVGLHEDVAVHQTAGSVRLQIEDGARHVRRAPGADVELHDGASRFPIPIADETDAVEMADAFAGLSPDQPAAQIPTWPRTEGPSRGKACVVVLPRRWGRGLERRKIGGQIFRVRRSLSAA